MLRKKKSILALAVLCVTLLVAGLVACAPTSKEEAQKTEETQAVVETPEADEFGVVVADSWKDIYPNQYNSYKANEANSPDSGKHNYLELYPALNTMYKGYAFSLGYDEASSHVYTLESVSNSPRTIQKEQLANCITCKTPQFTAKVGAEGDSVYSMKFNDLIGTFTEPISCWNCHENDPSQLKYGNAFWTNSMGADLDKVDAGALVCGQCHNEYYFNPDTKVTTNPYSGLDQMTPEAILAYYDEMGFKDWEHPLTGAAMIKVQHPEFETIYGGAQTSMAKLGYTCSDCHMGKATAEDGSEYTSHEWKSPLENQELLDSTCNTKGCHDDLATQVADWQAAEEEQVIAISEKIETLCNKVGEMRDAGTIDDETLAKVQALHRSSQFYWDFVMVENSEGAHNPELTMATLEKAEADVDEALALIGA